MTNEQRRTKDSIALQEDVCRKFQSVIGFIFGRMSGSDGVKLQSLLEYVQDVFDAPED